VAFLQLQVKGTPMRVLATAAIITAAALPAAAETTVAGSGDRTLVWIDTATATVHATISGLIQQTAP